MALSAANTITQVVGKQRQVNGTLTFDSSYPTGGLALAPSLLGLYAITSISIEPGNTDSTHTVIPRYNSTTGKVQAFWGDNANGAAAALIEVTNATNLSAVTCAFQANGA